MDIDNYEIVSIDNVSEIGTFSEEYVYDLEMEDESHTFISNDILVHNTDSIFVGFDESISNCKWKNRAFNQKFLDGCPHTYRIISEHNLKSSNENFKGKLNLEELLESRELPTDFKILLIDGGEIKNWNLNKILENFKGKVIYNWENEINLIHGIDRFRLSDYFKDKLDDHASKYGVENKQDFELEKISNSIINLEKKKYVQDIRWEDHIYYDALSYIQPKGIELVRSSTPNFARDKEMGIYRVVKYLFNNPDNYNIKELLNIVKEMRREFELAEVDDISGQSSCSKYEEKILNDLTKVEYVTGTHFAVKAAAYHNYLLHQHKELQNRYDLLKSGDKIKYYYTNSDYPIFAFKRGEYPIEFAPPVDYSVQFNKVIISPINGIISKMNMPVISKRLTVFMDIFSSL